MLLRECRVCVVLFFICASIQAQFVLSGEVVNDNNEPIQSAEVYLRNNGYLTTTDKDGQFSFGNLPQGTFKVVVFAYEYDLYEAEVTVNSATRTKITLTSLGEQLSEVVLTLQREKVFALKQLRKVEGTAIYAGKKSEVVLIDQITGNLAANNARQIYNQVVGLNIYDNGDAGLQLNIGGRGLDPNRTANFNVRQNGYDISADVLGYPESYYTPPAESLGEIQVVRGAASLQYGTQFGGLINFKFKKPNPNKKIELITRQTLGSNSLFTSFNSLSGTIKGFSYYTYYNYKEGNGFRPNSHFESENYFVNIGYQFKEKTKLTFEATFLNYLAKQAGGLTDEQFYKDVTYSNRERNWFKVNWALYALKLEHKFSNKTDFSLNVFGLDASRKAVGFRINRVSQADDLEKPRELLIDNFKNWGAEAKLLTRYNIFNKDAVFLVGSKYYKTNNYQKQGPGSTSLSANFNFAEEDFPNYDRQAEFQLPNLNMAVFVENIFNINDKLSITPGIRFDNIKTESIGSFRNIVLDLADNPILNERIEEEAVSERNIILLGVGATYKFRQEVEGYANFTQNYRSVTFNDIHIKNPSKQIDENIKDENGFTADFGFRGRLNSLLSYDVSFFGLLYDGRIGEILKKQVHINAAGDLVETGKVIRARGNIGTAFIYGFEGFSDWNLRQIFFPESETIKLNLFANLAVTDSEYTASKRNNVKGKKVEFIPAVNLKTGLNFGYKNLLGSFQYTYLSKQFTDATNAEQDKNDNQRGIEGAVPVYGILDFSLSYTYKKLRLETGINNLLDETYFTRRATGYPGPGIIPAQPRSFYATLQFKL
ncbi:MAG: TonB-dependent receptor [Cellulophaga sp.]